MDSTASELLRRLGDEGPRRFSAWDAESWGAYCRSVLPAARDRLAPSAFVGFAEFVRQGIGDGYLRGRPEAASRNFLEFCIREWLPETLPTIAADEHVPMLARVWNLGEGLLREPEWVNAYVMARVAELRGRLDPEAFLVDTLRPLLEPAPKARWEGPLRVTLLPLRSADDEFLPGDMHLAAPSVLVVADRRRPVQLGVHLRREGRSAVLGRFALASPFVEERSPIDVFWKNGKVHLGPESLDLPFLAAPFRWTLVRAGYLVASSVDSQKLWIVESAA